MPRFSLAAGAAAVLACASGASGLQRLEIGSSCGDAGYHMKVSNITVTPDPPVQGQVAMVTASGMINEAVTGGNVVLDVLLDGIQLYTNNANTCGNTTIELPLGFGTITIDSLACPAASGSTQNLSISLILPSGIPSGDYTVLFNATDQNSGPLYCLNASFTE